MDTQELIDQLNQKLDDMIDHLEDYTSSDFISITNQLSALYPDDPTPSKSADEVIKDFWEYCAKREQDELSLSQ